MERTKGLLYTSNHNTSTWAKVWNGPGWDKVGIKFTGSQPDPNFFPSLAPTNHPSVLVDISIFVDLKEEEKNHKQTVSIIVWI